MTMLLQSNQCRLKEDHAKARQLGEALKSQHYVQSVADVDTNIVIFTLAEGVDAAQVVGAFAAQGVLVSQMAPAMLRMVTHLDLSQTDVDRVVALLPQLLKN